MAYRITITSQPLHWSPLKIRMMKRDLLVMMSREGAPNCEFIVENLEGEEDESPKPILHLKCAPCGETFDTPYFSPCPKCGSRDVDKVHELIPEQDSAGDEPPTPPAFIPNAEAPGESPALVPALEEMALAAQSSLATAAPQHPEWFCPDCDKTFHAPKRTNCPGCKGYIKVRKADAA